MIDSDSESEDEEEEVKPVSKPANPDLHKPVFPVEKIICPGTEEYDAWMRKITEETEENNIGINQDIPALGPSLLPDEVPMPDKKPMKLIMEIDETKANAGFQNTMNAGRFWKVSQLIGTRKTCQMSSPCMMKTVTGIVTEICVKKLPKCWSDEWTRHTNGPKMPTSFSYQIPLLAFSCNLLR